MHTKSTKKFRVLVETTTDSDRILKSVSYRSTFASCVNYISRCQRNLYPHQCHVIYSVQVKDALSDSYITISSTFFEPSDLPF